MSHPAWLVRRLCACYAVFALLPAIAGEFSVDPIRLELGPSARSGALTVRNEGKVKLSFQIDAMAWTQDASGADQYGETRDLIFFPKIMTVEPGQEGVIRVGTKTPVLPSEKAYRLFIEELPSSERGAESPVQINVLIRFGAPIFINPAKAHDGIEIEPLSISRGLLSFAARNTGNRHQMVEGIQVRGADADGKEVYALTVADRYLLAGTVKPYTTDIPGAKCSQIAVLEIAFKTDKVSVSRRLDVSRAMCP